MKKIPFLVFYIILLNINAFTQEVRIVFLETTDIHGCIFPYDFITQNEANNSLAQVYTYMKQERSITGQKVILLDNLLRRTRVFFY